MKKLSDSTWLIHEGMTKTKIRTVTELGKRMGLARPTICRKVNCPATFTIYELQRLATLFNWSDEEFGAFLRGIT